MNIESEKIGWIYTFEGPDPSVKKGQIQIRVFMKKE